MDKKNVDEMLNKIVKIQNVLQMCRLLNTFLCSDSAVDNVMPLLQERYEAEHQKALQMRYLS